MGKSKGGLGRDFYSLLDDNSFESKGPVTKLALKDIQARRDQPRKDFDMNALQLLADSIREHGVMNAAICDEIPADLTPVASYAITGVVEAVSCKEPDRYPAEGEECFRVSLLDYGGNRRDSGVHHDRGRPGGRQGGADRERPAPRPQPD